ncbi:PKD domain-containing protein [Actinotalea ferrariae]|uniref:LamG-like jellyroll fold domain-containing protein n=1 Tax=Actinotalea ferrariae TaxID=1386098 RepID=UPI001C8B4F51|nr:LamG-like jellyroll fold domain-containing protein [Actinotalea ferrariae]MBX9244947.1 PKD domain-containing protein [Actinotalea ferrariae]
MSFAPRRPLVRLLATVAGAGMLVAGLVPPAVADTAPTVPGEPTTVSADGLPTVQIDGVVWQQVVIGDTVYAAGSFTTARPAGAAPGTSTVARANLLAYDLRTGVLKSSFAPTTNAQVLTIAASPDGDRLYIGGDFTEVNGLTVWRIAAIDPTTGALDPTFLPKPHARVRTIVADADTVWFGGLFSGVGTETRTRLAAARASDGALLPWAPQAAGASGVNALVLSPDGSTIVAGGSFTTLNGSSNPGYGLGAVDATTGALLPFAANAVVRNGGTNSAFTSLVSDGESVYGTGYHYGSGGNLEGTFAANWDTGELLWLEDCHGDTYSVWASDDVVYQASHKHYCANIGGFPQTEPWTFSRATAMTKDATHLITREQYGYANFEGRPTPSLLPWFPDLNLGKYTGQDQGPWTVTGTDEYVLMGGEFTTVNGRPQQGLVRFAVPSIAPNDVGPQITGGKVDLSGTSPTAGTIRLQWTANHDPDNRDLTYELYRTSTTTPAIHRVVQPSTFYQRPAMGFVDTGRVPGTAYRYRLKATDPHGNVAWSDFITVTASGTTAPTSTYADLVQADGAVSLWRLGESSGTRAIDDAGWNDLSVGTGVTRGTPGALAGDASTAATFNGTANGVAVTRTDAWGENSLTVEAWFRTSTTRGGGIIAFGNLPSGNSPLTDRQVYMGNDGRLNFGSRGGSSGQVVTSAQAYNDNQWHHVAATLGASGMRLYVDGVRVGSRDDVTKGRDAYGFWRVGGDNLTGWANRPTSNNFQGVIDEVAVYHQELTHERVAAHWAAGGRTSPLPAAPADAYGQAVQALGPELYWRTDERSGTTAADASFYANPGTYRNGPVLGAPGALAGVPGTAATFDGANDILSSARQVTNPRIYSLELFFRTTTTAGGTLLGLAGSNTALSTNRDRNIVMEADGRLAFGVRTTNPTIVRSAAAYNDGQWHHVVATQSGEGMRLYVDGALVGSDPTTTAQSYAGYWKVGGERTWGPQTYFAGSIDEVAVYGSALTPEQVLLHAQLAQGPPNTLPTAAFTETVEHLDLQVDGRGSADPDGTIATWAWDFGDGSTASGATATHRYDEAGQYDVRLTVTDDRGGQSTVVRTVTATDPPPPGVLAVDAFDRAVTNAWGTADIGGAWALTGSPTRFSVAGGVARMSLSTAGSGASAHLGTSAGDTDMRSVVSLDKLPNAGAVLVSAVARKVGADDYRTRVRIGADGAVTLALMRVVGSTETTLASGGVAGLTYAPGDRLHVRTMLTGTSPTTLQTVVWKNGQPEPAAWRLTTTDATANLQQPGGVGFVTYLGATATNLPVVVRFDDLSVVEPGVAPPADQPPVAAFVAQAQDLGVTLDGTSSSDPDGTVTAWSWDLGDGAVKTGATVTHTYGAAGTYPVRLTVTDDDGLTATTVQDVTVTAPGLPPALARDAFGRSVANAWGTADVGGAWTVVGDPAKFSVVDGAARTTLMNGGGASAYLDGVVSDRTDVSAVVGLPALPDAGAVLVSVTGRRVAADEYRTKLRVGADGVVTLALTRVAGSQELTLATTTVAGLVAVPGDRLRVRMSVEGTGTATLRAKVWRDGQAEPGWLRSTTNTYAPLQAPGSIGVVTYLGATATNVPFVVTVDELEARTPDA